jgi:Flp pilus assembly protein TadG
MRKGATAVEFALIFPLFFLLVMAGIGFGRAIMVRHQVQGAVSAAARAVAVNDVCQSSEAERAASRQSAKEQARANITSACALVGVHPVITFTETLRGRTTDTRITVEIPYNQFSLWPTSAIYTETCMFQAETLP